MTSVRTLTALLLIALPIWGQFFPTLMVSMDSITTMPEPAEILLFGMVLLAVTSSMRIRANR
jgi:hypothetical protein